MTWAIRLLPRSTLKGIISARFPASVTGESPIDVTNNGGDYSISLDLDALVDSLPSESVVIPAALTKVDDTNVTLTLGGTPTLALLKDTSITAGWTGTLAAARLNANVVQAITNDTNVTGSIATQTLTLGWTGTLATGRIADDAVSYAKMQNVSAGSLLLGRGDSGSGDPQEITVGSGLAMTGTTLSATGGGSGAATTEPYVTIGNTGGLSAERALTAGTDISITDGGAGTTVTVATFASSRKSNLGLAASIAGNALTIAVKDASGSDPSSTSPVAIDFRNVTLATGTPSTLSVTAATSLVISSGSTHGVVGTEPFRLWIVGFNDGGTFRLGTKNGGSFRRDADLCHHR